MKRIAKISVPFFSHFLIFTPLFMGMGHTCHRAGGQRTTRGSWFSPNITGALGHQAWGQEPFLLSHRGGPAITSRQFQIWDMKSMKIIKAIYSRAWQTTLLGETCSDTCFIKWSFTWINTARLACLHVVHGCFCTRMAERSMFSRQYGLTSLKYLLAGTLEIPHRGTN